MNLAQVIKGPVVTEKSLLLQEKGIWSFWVDPQATKGQIKEAIKKFFGVTPVKVKTITVPGKKKYLWRQRREVRLKRRKKALVELKPGEKIKLMVIKERKK